MLLPAMVVIALVSGALWLRDGPTPIPEAPKLAMELGLSPGAAILDLDDDELDNSLAQTRALGITQLRLDFDWSRIEATEGDYRWTNLDRVLNSAEEHDLSVHALLTYTPSWARPPGTSDKHPPTDPSTFGDFAASAVSRYRERVSSWEIWNEPNTDSFWEGPQGPDPEAYALLLSIASASIREVDFDTTIISAGLAPASDEQGSELSPETFLTGFLPRIEAGTIDAVGIHPYSYPAHPADDSKGWNLFGRLPQIRTLVTNLTGEDLPLRLTEYGAPTGSSSRAVSAETQQQLVVEALGCANRTPWIDGLFLYNLTDRPGGDDDDPEDNFGLHTADGLPKPSAEAVRAFQSVDPGDPIGAPCTDW